MDIAIEPAEKYSTEELARKMLAHISGVDPENSTGQKMENRRATYLFTLIAVTAANM